MGSIQRMDLDGSNLEDLGTAGRAYRLGIHDDKIYWGHESLTRMNLDGSGVEPLGLNARSFDFGNGKIYYATGASPNGSEFRSANLDGTGSQLVAPSIDDLEVEDLAFDPNNDRLYWVDDRGNNIKYGRVQTDGTDYQVLLTGSGVDSLAFDSFIADVTADFDGDFDVDGDDLTIWKQNYGLSDPFGHDVHEFGDADGDAAITGNDFLIWQREFGTGVPLSAATTVPEPTTSALTLAALCLAMSRRQC